MASDITLEVVGEKQGEITGEGKRASTAYIDLEGFSLGGTVLMDGAGLPTKRRVYRPVAVSKATDVTSPRLWSAFANNEMLSVKLISRKQSGSSTEGLQFYSIELGKARIVSIESMQSKSGVPIDEISFVFETVEITYDEQRGKGPGAGLGRGIVSFHDQWSEQ
ncbi:MAG: type VI secretion system tube protein Hcp [Burkholderiales bacterium]|nr:MAG: type VI secretion system tube protein Hcp [Burkholderiales bacterium]